MIEYCICKYNIYVYARQVKPFQKACLTIQNYSIGSMYMFQLLFLYEMNFNLVHIFIHGTCDVKKQKVFSFNFSAIVCNKIILLFRIILGNYQLIISL